MFGRFQIAIVASDLSFAFMKSRSEYVDISRLRGQFVSEQGRTFFRDISRGEA